MLDPIAATDVGAMMCMTRVTVGVLPLHGHSFVAEITGGDGDVNFVTINNSSVQNNPSSVDPPSGILLHGFFNNGTRTVSTHRRNNKQNKNTQLKSYDLYDNPDKGGWSGRQTSSDQVPVPPDNLHLWERVVDQTSVGRKSFLNA